MYAMCGQACGTHFVDGAVIRAMLWKNGRQDRPMNEDKATLQAGRAADQEPRRLVRQDLGHS